MTGTGADYEFGSGEGELARLELQGRALAPATRMRTQANRPNETPRRGRKSHARAN